MGFSFLFCDLCFHNLRLLCSAALLDAPKGRAKVASKFFGLLTLFTLFCAGLRLLCSLLCELFGEGFELFDAELAEPFEGHGPEDAGEDHDEEVADDSACVGVACAKRCEGRGESRLDGEDYGEAKHYLDDLGVPAGVSFKLGELAIHYVGGNKAQGAAHKGAGVLEAAFVIMGIKGFIAADGPNENEQRHRENNAESDYEGHKFIVLFIVHKHGAKNKNEGCSEDEGNRNVKKGMHAEIHSGEADEKYKGHARNYSLPSGLICGDSAESACGILSMSRGEGIACCGFLCVTHNLNCWVVNPRTGDAEEELCSLVKNRSEKTGYKDKISLPFIHAPEEENRHGEEEDLLTKPGDEGEKRIKYGVSYLRYSVEHIH